MKILMMTPSVDENRDIEGFIPTWIRKLSKKVDKLFVITPFYNKMTLLPRNAIVYDIHSLGEKWKGTSKLTKGIRFLCRQIYLHSMLFMVIPKVDVIFCHMHPIFTLRAAPYAKFFRKPIVTWYTHSHVSRKLRIAHFLSNRIVTASKESFRIKSDKVIVTGHGIDTARFKPAVNKKKEGDKKIILSVNRISPRKKHEIIIKTADILINEKGMKDLEFVIVGSVPMASQEEYYEGLKKMVIELKLEDYVKFVGSVPYADILKYYQRSDIFVSASQTGSIDKAALEAMACEKPVLLCNEAFEDVFGDYSNILMFYKEDPLNLAQKIIFILEMDKNRYNELCLSLRAIVKKEHNVDGLMNKLIRGFEECRN